METRRNRPAQECTVAVIGGGFTGATLAAQLVRHSGPFFSIVVVEKSYLTGRGVAYGTECRSHLLNVPANDMSAFPEDREHFLRWAKSNYDRKTTGDSFVPREEYGRYIETIVREAVLSSGCLHWKGMRPVPSLPTAMAESKFACEVGREFWRKRWSSRWETSRPAILPFPGGLRQTALAHLPIHIFRTHGRMRRSKAWSISAAFF